MDIYLIRHGQSLCNVRGQYDPIVVDANAPLTDLGIEQVKRTDDLLAKYLDYHRGSQLKDSNTMVFVSPFKRAVQTYENLLSIEEYPHYIDDLLTEINGGLFDIYPRDRVKSECQLLYDHWEHHISDNAYYARYPMGESPFDVSIRVRQFITKLTQLEYAGYKAIFIVVHGTWAAVFLKLWCNKTIEWYNSYRHLGNASALKIYDHGPEDFQTIIKDGEIADDIMTEA